jgi:superfamily I DNA/RNA helicase
VDENGQEAEDAIIRMAYVGMTRARRKLVLCEPNTKLYFEVA